MSSRPQKVMIPPVNLLFKLYQQESTVSVWLYDQLNCRIQGKISGFDEFMNVVIDDAIEIDLKGEKDALKLGKILLKGDNITLISSLDV